MVVEEGRKEERGKKGGTVNVEKDHIPLVLGEGIAALDHLDNDEA
jgi:hypothetical protein